MDNQKKQKNKSKRPNAYIRFTSVAIQMGATIFLGNLLGKWLDNTYQKTFWEKTVTMLAVFMAIYMVISQVIKVSKDND